MMHESLKKCLGLNFELGLVIAFASLNQTHVIISRTIFFKMNKAKQLGQYLNFGQN